MNPNRDALTSKALACTQPECEVALRGRAAIVSRVGVIDPNGSGNRQPRATGTRSANALGLGQTIKAGVQPRLNPKPALWRAIENCCSDLAAPSDREDPESLRLRGATAAQSASARPDGVLKRQAQKDKPTTQYCSPNILAVRVAA
jgi:hypothetical protein